MRVRRSRRPVAVHQLRYAARSRSESQPETAVHAFRVTRSMREQTAQRAAAGERFYGSSRSTHTRRWSLAPVTAAPVESGAGQKTPESTTCRLREGST